ncbi:MAG: fructose-6-phosphate aldolase [Sphingomonadales bacterium]|nr:fructose-6-phosphate aldolase [Sphingomonadales bacterium]
MEFFIDTANLDQISQARSLGILDGVTTNPSLMAKEGIKGKEAVMEHYRNICQIVGQNVSAEVIATDYEGMIQEGQALAALHPAIVVKVPMTRDGVRALTTFSKEGIRSNCTLIFSAGQALLAAKAGATYLSPFIGRLDDINMAGIELISQIVQIYRVQGYSTKILAASIRSSLHIVQCAEAGADVVTCPLSAIEGLLHHPLTDKGLAQFLSDHARNNAAS